MVACKFFLQGNCKFGTYCNYDHQIPSKYSYSNFENSQPSTSILRQSAFGGQNGAPLANATAISSSAATPNLDVLVKAVIQDMAGAEKGGQWLLSCYAPFKEKPAFPGFEDQSPEEIRLGFYEARKAGAAEQYKLQLQGLMQGALMKTKALQNPSSEVVGILQSIYNFPPASFSGTYGQNTTSNSTSNMLASSSGSSSFGQVAGSQNIFATAHEQATNSIFGGATKSGNIFAAPAQSPSQNQNVFATNNFGATSFGGQQPSNNSFVGSQATQPQGNIFGITQPIISSRQQPGNIFETQSQSPVTSNIFAPQNTTSVKNIFTSPPPAQPNIFTSPVSQQSNIFNSTFNAGSNPPQSAPPDYSASIFGGTANSNKAGFRNSVDHQVNSYLYSNLEELNEDEKRWFESKELDFNIPDKPPTYDMCFPK